MAATLTPPGLDGLNGLEGRVARRLTVGALVGTVLIGVLLLIVAFGAFLTLGSRIAASRDQDLAYEALRTRLGDAQAPVSGAIAPGTPVAILAIPRLDLEQVVLQGSASEQTAVGPGLRNDSSLPGQAGSSVIVGRRATFGAPFAHLDRLRPGDRISVTTGQGRFAYVVDLVRTSDAPRTTIAAVASRLTLVTSDPALAPSRQLTVSARLDGQAQPRATGVATVAADAPGEGSSDHLLALVLWSQLLLVAAVGLTWVAVRVPGRALWFGGVPVLLVLLWNVFANLAYLLPNTL